jgi:hypothetical protein
MIASWNPKYSLCGEMTQALYAHMNNKTIKKNLPMHPKI